MQKRKQKLIVKGDSYLVTVSLKIFFSLFFVIGLLLPLGIVKAEEPEGAFNNVLVKELPVQYHASTGTINGEAIIGNFSDQSFHSLTYKLELLAYDKDIDLGIIVHEEIAKDSFSISGQGEVKRSFSYIIPEGVPSGDYNFAFQVIDSRGRSLGFDSYSFTYSNNANNLILVNSESIKIEVNKEDHNWGEGPSTKKGDEVRLKFELTNNNQEPITNITPHLIIYPYTPSLKKVKEADLESFLLNPGETKQLSYQMPELTNPQSYLATIEFKKDNQLIALPIRGRWVVEGIQGKIFTAGIDKNNNLTLEVIGSPFSEEESGVVTINILDKNGKTCFSQEKKIAKVGAGTQIVSLPIHSQERCLNPTIEAELKIKDKQVDTYKKKLDSNSIKQLQMVLASDENQKSNKRKIALLLLIIPTIIVLITLVASRDKKGEIKFASLLLLIFLGGALFIYFPTDKIKAWVETIGKYNHWHADYNFFSGSWNKDKMKKQEQCIDNKRSYCNKVCKLRIYGQQGHDAEFSRVLWSQPAHNAIFKSNDNIWVKATMIHSWCNNGVPHSSKVYATVYSRDTGEKIKGSRTTVGEYNRFANWNIGTFEPGKYTIYLEVTGWAGFLYHGMIRHFEVLDCNCSPPACYENQEELLANDPFCTGEETTHSEPSYYSEGTADASPWTWNWNCKLGNYVKEGCKAYKAPQCGPAIKEVPLDELDEEHLCSVGNPSNVSTVDGKWSWTCDNGICDSKNCLANKQAPSCNIESDPMYICSGETSVTSKISAVSPIPANWETSWAATTGQQGQDVPFTLNFGDKDHGLYTATLTVTDPNSNLSGSCHANVVVKPAGCTVATDPSENLAVGATIEIIVNKKCVNPATTDPYILQILYQGSEVLEGKSYECIQEMGEVGDRGRAKIKIKKAGSFIFNAAVNKDGGGAVHCSSQTTVFTEGSEWWERRSE